MNQQWQVCELEESSNISLTLFERYSVVSVPESWILMLEDGTLVCFWPSVDPGYKIRSLHRPKDDEKGVYYKCRILMDGAKFSTYKEAKQAELIAQNVSSIIDTSVLSVGQDDENICDSTMHFDVADADIEETNENAEPDGGDFDVTSADDENTYNTVGNDSFEFNQAMLMRPYFSKRASTMDFEVDSSDDELSPKGSNETFFEKSDDYSATFNGANFLTSTVIDEVDFSPCVKRLKVSDTLSMVSALELKLSSLVNDFTKLKENLQEMETAGGSNATDGRSHTASSDEAEQNKALLSDGNDEFSVHQLEIFGGLPLESQPIAMPVEEFLFDDVCDDVQISNDTFLVKSVHVSDKSDVGRPELINIVYIPSSQDASVDVGQGPPVPVAKIVPIDVMVPEEVPSENGKNLPINRIEDHDRNEELLELDEDDFKSDLMKLLIPLDLENEAGYMNRTILIVFTPIFFLDGVSWKKEPKRINIKNSNLLSCWIKIYRTKFDPDFDATADPDDFDFKKFSQIFQDHFRRLKSALRAANKAELKRKQNGNVKSKKK